MDNHYDFLFDNRDAEDERYHDLIPALDVKIFQRVLEKDLEIINNSTLTLGEWAKFKFELLKCEQDWQTQVFTWIPSQTNSKPYISIQVIWDSLEGKSSRYFQVHMCFENVWPGKGSLANVWEAIDNE